MEAEENVHLDETADAEADPPQKTEDQSEAAAGAEADGGACRGGPAAAATTNPSPKKWFIIHTYSGFENKVAESLRTPRRGLRICRQDRPDPDSRPKKWWNCATARRSPASAWSIRATCWWRWK